MRRDLTDEEIRHIHERITRSAQGFEITTSTWPDAVVLPDWIVDQLKKARFEERGFDLDAGTYKGMCFARSTPREDDNWPDRIVIRGTLRRGKVEQSFLSTFPLKLQQQT
jgi:hypothetical protein